MLPRFLIKLQDIVNNVPAETGGWSEDGTAYEVRGSRFETEYLPAYFNGSRSTFIRQLHFYGFQKLENKGECWAFSHPSFLRDSPHLLFEIKRKKKKSEEISSNHNDETKRVKESYNALRSEFRKMAERVAMLEHQIAELGGVLPVHAASRKRQLKPIQSQSTTSTSSYDFRYEVDVQDRKKSAVQAAPKWKLKKEYGPPSEATMPTTSPIVNVDLLFSVNQKLNVATDVFGEFLSRFVRESKMLVEDPQTKGRNYLPYGHPFKYLCDQSPTRLQKVLVGALSEKDSFLFLPPLDSSLLIIEESSYNHFYHSAIHATKDANGDSISEISGGAFLHFLSLLMDFASDTYVASPASLDEARSPLIHQLIPDMPHFTKDCLISARNALEEYNSETQVYHNTLNGTLWVTL